MDTSTVTQSGPTAVESQPPMSPQSHVTSESDRKKRSTAIFVIVAVTILLIGIVIMLLYLKLTYSNKGTASFLPGKKGEYINPFLGTGSYQNPFSTYKNPFENIR